MDSLRDKLYNYGVNPPPHTWDKIAIDLDESELNREFPSRLHNLEVTPPADAWEKVNSVLNPSTKTVVKPLYRKLSPVLKYAAAAIFIGAIAFVVLKLVVNSDSNKGNATQVTENKDTVKSDNNSSAETKEAATATNNSAKDEANDLSNNLVASLDPPVKRIAKKLNAFTGRSKIREALFPDAELSKSIYAYEDHVPSIAERYVMLMTPDGNIIRMAKKWSDLLCCVSGEEQDADCKDQLKKWQQKIAASALAPSPGNFMDILGLVSSLEDNTEL